MSWGNYDTSEGNNLKIVFEKCTAEKSPVPCKSDSEIKDWMINKFIILLTNEKEFTSHKFGDESISAFS